ncbi:MAG TPA: alanine dehydrogenase [Planctomycetes bacterium]|nr:alanine dehydrogenase [Planctomycetota bacterium]
MQIGCPTEVKAQEFRVGLTPNAAREAVAQGHDVLIQSGAGLGAGFEDADYTAAGARIVPGAEEVFAEAEMIVKVKEPQPAERAMLREGQLLFTYLHLAPDPGQTEDLLRSGATCIAYETIEDKQGRLPLLTPMSEVAGRMAIQQGAKYLEMPMKGRGILLGGVPGVEPAHVGVLGGGVVGANAARIAAGTGANVFILDIDLDRLRYLDEIMPENVTTLYSTNYSIADQARKADLLVGAVLTTGARAPVLVPRALLAEMKNGSVIVDVAVDQGGAIETTRPTTHEEPTYVVDGVVHYCVANMPGAVGRTSTFALTNATLPYARRLADQGAAAMAKADPGFAKGINVIGGKITYQQVAEAFEMDYTPLSDVL